MPPRSQLRRPSGRTASRLRRRDTHVESAAAFQIHRAGKYRSAMPIDTVADILRVHAAARPEAVCLVLDDIEVTWGRLHERARRVAAGLTSAGVGPGDRVAFLDKNGIEHFEVMFGAAFCNAVPVDLNWRLAPPEIAYIVEDCQAKALVVGADYVRGARRHRRRARPGHARARHRRAPDRIRSYDDVGGGQRRRRPARRDHRRRHRAPALLQRHDGTSQGRDAQQPQPAGADARRRRLVGLRRASRSTSSRCRCSTSAAAAGRSSACSSAPAACSSASSTRPSSSKCWRRRASRTPSWCRRCCSSS